MISAQKKNGRALVVITTVWLLVGLLSYGQNYLFSRIKEEAFYPIESFSFTLIWLSWIPFTYPVIWISLHIPLSKGHVLRALSLHLLAAAFIIVAHLAFNAWIMSVFWTAFIYPVIFQEMFLKLLTFSVFTDIIIYALVVAVVHGLEFYQGLQAEKIRRLALERDLSDVRLNALKAQLQPHFLFNTHHTIISLLEEGKPEEATQMILGLSDLLRYSLRNHQANLIPLRQELELLNLYLNIQKIRFQDRLCVNLHCEEESGAYLVPAMVLQPLVENAIKHAVEPYSGCGRIEITVQKNGHCLLLQVQDNGPLQNQKADFTYGIGLSNTQARLQQLYQNRFELVIQSNYPDRGVLAWVKIPLQTSKKKTMIPCRVLIADDELPARNVLQKHLGTLPEAELVATCSNGKEAVSAIITHRPHIIFLDIAMPDLNGFQVLEQVNSVLFPIVVFTTAYDEYALKAFEAHAIDYLLKPFDRARFEKAFRKAYQQYMLLHHQEDQALLTEMVEKLQGVSGMLSQTKPRQKIVPVKDGGKTTLVKTEEVLFLEASGNYVTLHLPGKRFLIHGSLSSLAQTLDPQIFIRIHRSFIVNLGYIKEIHSHFNGDYTVYLSNEQTLPLSRNYKDNLKGII